MLAEDAGDDPRHDTAAWLVALLRHPSPVVREGALYGLAKLADHTRTEALHDALQRHADESYEPSQGVRAVAKEMLETMRRIYSKDK
jgi:HEAT repeat protein